MISFQVDQYDSILTLPIAFPITTETKFRNQQVRVQIEVPVGKEIFINDRAENLNSYTIRPIRTNRDGLTFDWDNDNGYNYMWTSGKWYIMTERGLEAKDRSEGVNNENRIEDFKQKIKEMGGSIDSVSIKIQNGDTTLDMNIRTNAFSETLDEEENEADEPNSSKGRRMLFTALDLMRIRR
jgi:hypothetical protein